MLCSTFLRFQFWGVRKTRADQVAAYLILHLDEDIKRQAIAGVAFMYGKKRSQKIRSSRTSPTSTASPHNACIISCASHTARIPKLFGDVLEMGYLPKDRAELCTGEYKQIDYAFEEVDTSIH